jgi:hypothetical protein
MNEQPSGDNKQDADGKPVWFKGVLLVSDAARGIYIPKPYSTEDETEQHRRAREDHSPLDVKVRTDWGPVKVSALIGVGTLILLAATIYFAKLQWHEMVRAADASNRSARAASISANTASESFEESQESFRDTLSEMRIQSWSQWQSANAAITASRADARQVGAMQDLASQAERSANTAETAFKIQVRPWVGVVGDITINPVSCLWQVAPDKPCSLPAARIDVRVKNYGTLPALHVNILATGVPNTGNKD